MSDVDMNAHANLLGSAVAREIQDFLVRPPPAAPPSYEATMNNPSSINPPRSGVGAPASAAAVNMAARPALPQANRNPMLLNLPEECKSVKFQTIVRETKEIIVGRVKVPTPTAHAFILRRFDTDAISLTTMYKVAFPGSSEEQERQEMDWVRNSFDTRGTNGNGGPDSVRLAGQWVSRHVAVHLAPAYGLKDLLIALCSAVPDPLVDYRKSHRSQQMTTTLAQPQQQVDSGRLKRPRTAAAPPAGTSAPRANTYTLEATTTVTGPAQSVSAHMDEQIAEAKKMVNELRKQMKIQAAAGLINQELGEPSDQDGSSRGTKRVNHDDDDDDEGVNGRDAQGGVVAGPSSSRASGSGSGSGSTGYPLVAPRGDRVIRTNRKVESGFAQGAKAFALNAFIFGLGVSAAAFLPQLAASYF